MISNSPVPPVSASRGSSRGGPNDRATDESTIAGYRIVRRGPERHGGHVRHGVAASPSLTGRLAHEAGGDARTAVSIVTFDGNVGEERATRLIEMHERLAGSGVPRVRDVVVDSGGSPAVVLDFCGDTVASILARGAEITAGEVVTIVAPILSAVVSMHDRGYVHGGVSVAAIAIGTGGRPLLLGCERATPLPNSSVVREREAMAGEDVRNVADVLAELATAVRDQGERERVLAASGAIRSGASTPFSSAFRAAAEVRLFEIAEAAPVTFTPMAVDAALDERAPALATREPRRVRVRRESPVGVVPRVSRVVGSARRHAGSWLDSLARRIPGRRRGPLILGGVIVVGTILVLVSTPTGGTTPSDAGHGADRPGTSPSGAAETASQKTAARANPDGPGQPDRAEPKAAAPSPPADAAEDRREVAPTDDQDADTTEDDATERDATEDVVAAARVAIDALAACASSSTEACWGSAIEPGTDLLAEIAASEDPMTLLPAALALPPDALDIAAREEYGDARVVTVVPADETKPASILMIRTEAGWRIREAFDA